LPDQGKQPVEPDQSAEPTRRESPVYTSGGIGRELRQGEIITNVAQYTYDPVTGRARELYHAYVLVAAQDCDLLQDYDDHNKGGQAYLNEILIYEVEGADEFRVARSVASKDWRLITQNRDDRYHYLEEAPSDLDLVGIGLPSLIIDFKRYFSISPKELYRQADLAHGARRRCRLEAPYREHLQTRAAFYLQRVMLPLSHGKALPFPAASQPVQEKGLQKSAKNGTPPAKAE
jgi:hypothetical protein